MTKTQRTRLLNGADSSQGYAIYNLKLTITTIKN